MKAKLKEDLCALVDLLEEMPSDTPLYEVAGETRVRATKLLWKHYSQSESVPALVEIEVYARIALALLGPDRVPPLDQLDACIVDAIHKQRARFRDQKLSNVLTDSFDMDSWHCGTSHCRAGWAIHLHENGRALEKVFDSGVAGAIIYLRSTGNVPNFFAAQSTAWKAMNAEAAQQRAEANADSK